MLLGADVGTAGHANPGLAHVAPMRAYTHSSYEQTAADNRLPMQPHCNRACTGPGAGPGFQADFYLGNCSLSGDPIPTFDCQGPSATFTSTPATFTAKYKSAVEFVGEVRLMAVSSSYVHTHICSHVRCGADNAV